MDRETDFGFNGGKAATRTILSQKWGLSPFLVYAQTQQPPLSQAVRLTCGKIASPGELSLKGQDPERPRPAENILGRVRACTGVHKVRCTSNSSLIGSNLIRRKMTRSCHLSATHLLRGATSGSGPSPVTA